MNHLSVPEWTPALSVGVEKWDAEHRQLFMLVKDMARMAAHSELTYDLMRYLRFLKSYIEFHFRSEELAMQELHYAPFESHRAQHLKFEQRVNEFEQALNESDKVDVEAFVEYLCQWLLQHIATSDTAYAQFFKDKEAEIAELRKTEPSFSYRLEYS